MKDGVHYTMWIKSNNPSHKYSGVGRKPGFRSPEMDERVAFDENGKARVKKAVGEYLVENFEMIEIVQDETNTEASKKYTEELSD